MTLDDDFGYWWKMEKYSTVVIGAKKYKDVKVVARHGSNEGWPTSDKRVKYWVELENGIAVGVITHPSAEEYCEFPVAKMK